MTRSPAQVNRFFVSTDFSVSYRRAKQLQWQSQATAGYSLLAVLAGEVVYEVEGRSLALHAPQLVLFEPNATVGVSAKDAELIFLTFSASLVMQHAETMDLLLPKSTVTFKRGAFDVDQKVGGVFVDFVSELTDDKPGKEIVMRALVEQLLVHAL